MIICVQCKKEMKCEKNGVGADFGNGHVYAGDKYKCPKCESTILYTNPSASYDPEYMGQEEYVKMDQ